MDEQEALRAESRRDEAIVRALDALIAAGLSGAMSWAQVHATAEVLDMDGGEVVIRRGERPRDLAEFLIAIARAEFTESQQHSLPAAFAAGAQPWECIPLGVHGRNCHGEDLALVSKEVLQWRFEGTLMLEQAFGASRWLNGYRRLVEHELRERTPSTVGRQESSWASGSWERTEMSECAETAWESAL